jgi:hypothetical protein
MRRFPLGNRFRQTCPLGELEGALNLPVVQDLARPSVWGQDMNSPTKDPPDGSSSGSSLGSGGLPREATLFRS